MVRTPAVLIERSSGTHWPLMVGAKDVLMAKQLTSIQQRELLDIIWAIVLLQGGILVLSATESFVANLTQGFLLIAVFVLTALAAAATLLAARGLRQRKRWARRLTMTGEWFVLVLGVIELVATQLIDPAGIDLVPLITGAVMPITVLVLMSRAKGLFVSRDDRTETVEHSPELEAAV